MANLLIICDTKRQVCRLFNKTVSHLMRLGHAVSYDRTHYHVIDEDSGDQGRFVTLWEIERAHIDDGYHAMRIEGKAYEVALDRQEEEDAQDGKNKTNNG